MSNDKAVAWRGPLFFPFSYAPPETSLRCSGASAVPHAVFLSSYGSCWKRGVFEKLHPFLFPFPPFMFVGLASFLLFYVRNSATLLMQKDGCFSFPVMIHDPWSSFVSQLCPGFSRDG